MLAAVYDVLDLPPRLLAATAFVIGACIGSFLNVVIARLPAGKSVVRPGSRCACGQPLPWHDNIPILSWLVLRGRARCCGQPISVRYPVVEALTAVSFLACWLLFPPAVALCGWIFLGLLIAAAFIDLEHMIIPDALSIGLGAAGIVLSFLVPALHGQHGGVFILDSLRSGGAALLGLLVGSGLVLWIAMLADAVLQKESMGLGDVKFVGGIGAFCGWHGAVFAIFGGALVGTVWLALALACRRLGWGRAAEAPPEEPRELGFGTQVPFGPMLAAAGAIYFLVLHSWVDDWFGQVSALF